MEVNRTEISLLRQYLEDLCKAHPESITKFSELPFRLTTKCFIKEEIEGECLELVFRYLSLNKIPTLLSTYFAKTVAQYILSRDDTTYVLTPEAVPPDSGEERDESTAAATLAEEPVTLYDAGKIWVDCINKVLAICETLYQDVPQLTFLYDGHISANSTVKYPDAYETSTAVVKNLRNRLEDRHFIVQNTAHLFGLEPDHNASYFAVFDGHVGIEAAKYASAHLHVNLVRHPSYPTDMETALRDAVTTTDKNFLRRAKQERLKSGCTAVCLVIYKNNMYWAWLGDGIGIVVRNNKALDFMTPHKPGREDEKKRIQDAGGSVLMYRVWRVNGVLAVARAIGDIDYKKYIIGEPDLHTCDLDSAQDQYAVIACDGLWDGIEPDEVPLIIKEHFEDETFDTLAQSLVTVATRKGSTDNISVIVVRLTDSPDDSSTDSDINVLAEETGLEEASGDRDDAGDSENTEDKDTDTSEGSGNSQGDSGSQHEVQDITKDEVLVCLGDTAPIKEPANMDPSADKENSPPLSDAPFLQSPLLADNYSSAAEALISCLPQAPLCTPPPHGAHYPPQDNQFPPQDNPYAPSNLSTPQRSSLSTSHTTGTTTSSSARSLKSRNQESRAKFFDSGSSINVQQRPFCTIKRSSLSGAAADRSRPELDSLSHILGPQSSSQGSHSGQKVHCSTSGDGGSSGGSRAGRLRHHHTALIHSFRGISTSDVDSGSPRLAARVRRADEGHSGHRSSSTTTTTKSDASITEMALMSKTAAKCVSSRKAKRSKTGRNGVGRNGRASSNVYKTVGPRGSHSRGGVIQNSDHMFHVLTGWSAGTVRRSKAARRWTVAREIDGAAMFVGGRQNRSPIGVATEAIEPEIAQALFE